MYLGCWTTVFRWKKNQVLSIFFKDDANVSMESAQEETGETKANGDTSAEAESSEQTMEEAMDESSEVSYFLNMDRNHVYQHS